MDKTIFGVFNNRADAEAAIHELKSSAYRNHDIKDNISVIMRDSNDGAEIEESTGASVVTASATGAMTGGVIGAIAGLLIGVGTIALPPLGGIFIAGPLAAALGISTTAATTLSGGALGALGGGLVGGLVGLGLNTEDAEYYETAVKNNKILVSALVRGDEDNLIKGVFQKNHAIQVRKNY